MRVAIFTEVFLPKIDGITNRLRHTIRCLLEDGHTVQLFVPATAAARYPGVRVVQIPGVPFRAYPEIQYTLPHPRVLSELMRFAPEVVHVVGPATMGVWGTMAARALGIPLVSSFHTDFPKYLADYGLGWGLGIVWPLLRICHNAEDTVSRWYGDYQNFLLSLGDRERAGVCGRLAITKRLHAQALAAWISNLKRR